ncbi:hypothetical protein NQ160_15315, partial [Microbacterium sp. zg.Y909]|nr:hypothetical protein [Microbacterium sp. zg.Y909]
VKVTGGVAAGVVLLGIGFGAGWGVSNAVEPTLAGNAGDSELWHHDDMRWDDDDDHDDSGRFGRGGPLGGMDQDMNRDMDRPSAPQDSESDVAPEDGGAEVTPDTESEDDSRGDETRPERRGPGDRHADEQSGDDATQSSTFRF